MTLIEKLLDVFAFAILLFGAMAVWLALP